VNRTYRSAQAYSEIPQKGSPFFVPFRYGAVAGKLLHWYEEDDTCWVLTDQSGSIVVFCGAVPLELRSIPEDDFVFDVDRVLSIFADPVLMQKHSRDLLVFVNFAEDVHVSLGGRRLSNVELLNGKLFGNPNPILCYKERRYLTDFFRRFQKRLAGRITLR